MRGDPTKHHKGPASQKARSQPAMESRLPKTPLRCLGLDTNEKAAEMQGHEGSAASALYMKDIYTDDS